MKTRVRQWLARASLLLAFASLAKFGFESWPLENRLTVQLGPEVSHIRQVQLSVFDHEADLVSRVDWRVQQGASNPLTHRLRVSRGIYRIAIQVQKSDRPEGIVDENHEGDWTWLGVEHQIQLEGGDYTFPPPHRAK